MKIKYTVLISFGGLRANKMRSSLTMLGIVIGISAIILIMSLGQSMENLILGELQGIGAETITIRPGREPKGISDIAGSLFSDSLKNRDVEALKRATNVPGLADIMPSVIVAASASYGRETYNPIILGASAEIMSEVLNVYPDRGTLFDESDIRRKANVATIGSKVAKELFNDEDPIGKNIKIKDRKFKVVAVYPPTGQVAFLDIDDVIIVPYTTAQIYLLGIDYYHEIAVRAKSAELVQRTVRDIELTLRESHGITDPSKDDFFLVTQKGAIDQIKSIIGALTIFLSLVVAVALVVGGIGIMNIMLVSVTERTREIGLRKALGATKRNILEQFLLEAIMLTGVGGILGLIFGAVFSFVAAWGLRTFVGLSWSFSFPISAALLGFIVSVSVGLIFGLYPAKKASERSPIDALRYE